VKDLLLAAALERVIETLSELYVKGNCTDTYLSTRLDALFEEWKVAAGN